MSESKTYRLLRGRPAARRARSGPPEWFLRALGLEEANRPYQLLKARAAVRRAA